MFLAHLEHFLACITKCEDEPFICEAATSYYNFIFVVFRNDIYSVYCNRDLLCKGGRGQLDPVKSSETKITLEGIFE